MFDDNPKTIDLAQLSPVSALALPAANLMLGDGDGRLDVDRATGFNVYGCAPMPRPDTLDFASSTASNISLRGMEAAEALRRSLLGASIRGRLDRMLLSSASEIQTSILSALGFHGQDGVTAVLAASGTTAILIATNLCVAGSTRPAAALVVGPEETGRGVAMAATGRHPSARTPLGRSVKAGGHIAGFPRDFAFSSVAIRDASLNPLPRSAVVDAIATEIRRLVNEGRRPVLHAVEGSKTGLSAPGFEGVMELRKRFPDLPIIVDACQWRGQPALLRRYIEANCIVIVTGSKFFGGPAFSGAILLPHERGRSIPALARGLADYSWRGDWPARCEASRHALTERVNPGLLLRWQAALAEIEAFEDLPDACAGLTLQHFTACCEQRLGEAGFTLLPTAIQRGADPSGIVAFAVGDSRSGWLGQDALAKIYRLLNQDVSSLLPKDASAEEKRLAKVICHIGQPVAFSAGSYPAVLRMAAGARLVVADHERGAQWLGDAIADAVGKLSLIRDRLLTS